MEELSERVAKIADIAAKKLGDVAKRMVNEGRGKGNCEQVMGYIDAAKFTQDELVFATAQYIVLTLVVSGNAKGHKMFPEE